MSVTTSNLQLRQDYRDGLISFVDKAEKVYRDRDVISAINSCKHIAYRVFHSNFIHNPDVPLLADVAEVLEKEIMRSPRTAG